MTGSFEGGEIGRRIRGDLIVLRKEGNDEAFHTRVETSNRGVVNNAK